MTLGTIRFVHTADWQIGKPYVSVEEAHNRALLQQERVEVILRIGALARQHEEPGSASATLGAFGGSWSPNDC